MTDAERADKAAKKTAKEVKDGPLSAEETAAKKEANLAKEAYDGALSADEKAAKKASKVGRCRLTL
jgi:hypothetical protein